MPRRKRASIRLWQTELFVVVIVTAILILSGSLSAGLKGTLTAMAEANELRNASSLARRLESSFPVTPETIEQVRHDIAEYRNIYEAGIWVYDRDGVLLESSYDGGPSEKVLEAARRGGFAEETDYARMSLRPGGWVVAARAVHGPKGTREGVVVSASPVSDTLEILDAVRYRLWVTFWVSLTVAGLLGFTFSELIGRRIRAMSKAAAAIAAGDFEQRLPTGLIPDEVYDLAESYNSMAERLGEAFGRIQDSERRLVGVVESMAEGLVSFDPAGIVRVVNPEAVRLLGLPAQGVAGRRLRDFTSEPAVAEVVDEALAGRVAARTVELGRFSVLLHATPLLGAERAVEGAVLLLADVTEQRRIEEAQRRFVADASHEMRTPVAALKGMLELLADGAKEDPEVRDDFIRTMQVESDRLGRLVSDLLTLAQLEAGSLRLEIAPQRATDLLGDVANVMQTLAEGAGVRLAVEAPDPDLQVRADRDRVVQVLLSFTDNALKHAPAGSTVHLRAIRNAEGVRFEVADEGPGIDAEALSRVFERFYRADDSRSGNGGTGLGLAIAKEIVESHGSSIQVRSETGEGTTFAFELPAA